MLKLGRGTILNRSRISRAGARYNTAMSIDWYTCNNRSHRAIREVTLPLACTARQQAGADKIHGVSRNVGIGGCSARPDSAEKKHRSSSRCRRASRNLTRATEATFSRAAGTMAAPAPPRPYGPSKKMSNMRAPASRPGTNRAQTATPTLSGRVSPAESVASKCRTPKRKTAAEAEDSGEETNINVVVRCRGRNDREVRENSGVVVSTDGVKGKKVELSMGPSALSNKTYHFDKVFSPAADQGMVFDEVVTPILDEVCILYYDENLFQQC